ncbi:hypothetical protein WICMUC_000872 [Wickerhamomyces mucosus]|uniref:FYVE-type domain-containing protein n=1 Tax=Wickerhamomyces mucosus TaxID=1378264 RepID=A0A9P8TI96_9ASCO|nr:hypothetical protein WICMUC_000872 [Wickerhamomyces mucosus]
MSDNIISNNDIMATRSEDTGVESTKNDSINAQRSLSDTIPRVPYANGLQPRQASNSGGNDVDESAIQDQDLPGEITFEKRSIPKPRTQSIQSVLSSVSLRSLAQQNGHLNKNPTLKNKASSSYLNKSTPFIPPQNQSQPQFINTIDHIQAPATTASSKRRSSFEIGQRLPFIKDASANDEQPESEGENEDEEKLTVDALKNLSNFSKFIPAEVDLTIPENHSDTTPQVKSEHDKTAMNIQENHKNAMNAIRSIGSTASLTTINHLQTLRQPIPSYSRSPLLRKNSSPIIQNHESQPKLLSATTSSQNLPNTNPPTSISNSPSTSSLNANRFSRPRLSQQQSQTPSVDSNSVKGLSDLKRPMYIPAVLRQSPTNLKHDEIQKINAEKLEKSKKFLTNVGDSISKQTLQWKLSFHESNHQSLRSSKSLKNLQQQPTRAHWRRDVTRKSCAYCEKPFTFFDRRHHCRKCGDIFCSEHTSRVVKLNRDAQFLKKDEFESSLCKVCNSCFNDYEKHIRAFFETEGTSSRSLSKNKNNNGNGNGNGNITINNKGKKNTNDDEETKNNDGAIAGSVPVDWKWSSF